MKTYEDLTNNKFNYNNNKCDITSMFLFTVISKVTYRDNQLQVMPLHDVISKVIISKFIRGKVIISVVVVSFKGVLAIS
jgi:hypothetical protein